VRAAVVSESGRGQLLVVAGMRLSTTTVGGGGTAGTPVRGPSQEAAYLSGQISSEGGQDRREHSRPAHCNPPAVLLPNFPDT
jgi:hypothetical protein